MSNIEKNNENHEQHWKTNENNEKHWKTMKHNEKQTMKNIERNNEVAFTKYS